MADTASGSSAERLDTAALLAIARSVEPDTSERTLEFWRNRGLLPHPERTGQYGARPVWTYPAEAADQLRALLELRSVTKDTDVLRVALWFDGHPVPTSLARASMITHLRQLQTRIEKELTKKSGTAGEDAKPARWHAITEIATQYAGRRGPAVPRFGRQPLNERAHAFAVLFGLGLGEPAAVDQLGEAAEPMERVMGLDQGRRYRPDGVEPWLTGPAAEGFAVFGELANLPRLIETLESTQDTELDAVRPIASALQLGLAAFTHMADAFAGYRNATGMSAMAIAADNLEARLLLPALLVSLMRSPVLAENVTAVVQSLTDSILPLRDRLRHLAALPEAERAAQLPQLETLPWIKQNQVRRLIGDPIPPNDVDAL